MFARSGEYGQEKVETEQLVMSPSGAGHMTDRAMHEPLSGSMGEAESMADLVSQNYISFEHCPNCPGGIPKSHHRVPSVRRS